MLRLMIYPDDDRTHQPHQAGCQRTLSHSHRQLQQLLPARVFDSFNPWTSFSRFRDPPTITKKPGIESCTRGDLIRSGRFVFLPLPAIRIQFVISSIQPVGILIVYEAPGCSCLCFLQPQRMPQCPGHAIRVGTGSSQ
jgi:hypothetical protein